MRAFLSAFLLLAPLVFAAPATRSDECGSTPSDDEVQFARQLYANRSATVMTGWDAMVQKKASHRRPHPIDVYWHVVYEDRTEANGYTPRKHITDSIEALNKAFGSSGYSFKLKKIDRTKNAAWWRSLEGSAEQRAMKETLHRGDETDLNVWTSSIPGLRGYATFPYQYDDQPKLDGVVLIPSSLVGGSDVGYNIGVTLIHEVGHWTGLYHTFQGGCSEPGDSVDDTPQSASPSTSCDKNRDSCPGNPGKDPVTNYMDYSPHTCKNNFTPGQIDRMQDQMKLYRGLKPAHH